MAAAEDQRARAIERLEQLQRMVRHGGDEQRQPDQDGKEHKDRRDAGRPTDRMRQAGMIGRRCTAKQYEPDDGAEHDGADLAEG